MKIHKKINIIVSVFNLVMFLVPVIIILLTDFTHSLFLSKGSSIFYHIIIYIWFATPAIISLIVYSIEKYKNKTFDILMIILNLIVLFWLFPMFKAYVFN